MSFEIETIVLSLLLLISLWISKVIARGWGARRNCMKLRDQGLPMPKHSMLTGHLLTMKPIIDRLPSDVHPSIYFGQLAKEFPNGNYYLDMWPFFGPLLICTSLNMAVDTNQRTAIAAKKPESLVSWFHTISGGPNLFDMEEKEWKMWRNIFNPGFSQAHIFRLIPTIVEEALAYRRLLSEYAERGVMFRLDEETLWFTMDMIGSLILENNLDSKKTKNPLAVALLSQIRWHVGDQVLNPFIRYNPFRLWTQRRNSRQMNAYIGRELDRRYEDYKLSIKNGEKPDSKSVISLVLEDYMKGLETTRQLPASLDQHFRSYATFQIRTFLFAGHDTTSSSICHIFYLLSKNPKTFEKLRTEHELVLGSDPAMAANIMSTNPQTLNQLPYTTAVVKEALRLFPPASSVRQGIDGTEAIDDEGNKYPTPSNTTIWILHQALHRNAKYWPDPDSFIPERWIVEPGHPLHPAKWAWRPFEFGPRNCIGQGLVMNELKVILGLVVREFDVKDAYEEFDRESGRNGIKMVEGERAYQIEKGGAHPADFLPCRVSRRR